MVAVITNYECGICRKRHNTKEQAEACEAKGPMPEYPTGMLWGNNSPEAFYSGIVFSIKTNHELNGHLNDPSCWAFRDHPPVGDSIDNECCGGELRMGSYHAHLDITTPAFARAVEYVKSRGLEPTVWDGEKPVELETFLQSKTNREIRKFRENLS